jgi:hypothetical protein
MIAFMEKVLCVGRQIERLQVTYKTTLTNKRTFLGWNSYLTQCWNPFPFIFIDVKTRQFPTKCAEYPTPLLVLKLRNREHNISVLGCTHNFKFYNFKIQYTVSIEIMCLSALNSLWYLRSKIYKHRSYLSKITQTHIHKAKGNSYKYCK